MKSGDMPTSDTSNMNLNGDIYLGSEGMSLYPTHVCCTAGSIYVLYFERLSGQVDGASSTVVPTMVAYVRTCSVILSPS